MILCENGETTVLRKKDRDLENEDSNPSESKFSFAKEVEQKRQNEMGVVFDLWSVSEQKRKLIYKD